MAAAPALHVNTGRTRIAVEGIGFGAREPVIVRLVGQGVVSARVTASAAGAFRVVLRRPPGPACGALALQASGARGSAAFLRFRPHECNPPGLGEEGNR